MKPETSKNKWYTQTRAKGVESGKRQEYSEL